MADVAPGMPKSVVENWKAALFERSWQQHRQRVLNLLIRLTSDADCADDLCQEVAVRAFSGYQLFRSESSTYTWLYRIAVNVVLRYREKRSIATDSLSTQGGKHVASDRAHWPETASLTKDLQQAVKLAVDKLPDDLRTVVVLSAYEQLRYREIAAILDVPVGTIKSRRHTANAILRKELSDYAI
jgi:RNA polymerase sigma-70 factor (ECF subfamily)